MKTIRNIFLGLVATCMVQGCTEDIDMSDRYTFQTENIAGYLESHSDYSEYYRLLGEVAISPRSSSTVQQMMSARGNYTVFAPTNEAIQEYLDELCEKKIIAEPSWDAFKTEEDKDSIRKVIVYNSIMDAKNDNSFVYMTSGFPKDNEEFGISNMYDRKLTVVEGPNATFYINGTKDNKTGEVLSGCLVDKKNCDILASNGYIHQVHSVVAPSNETVADWLKNFIDSEEGGFVVMAKLIFACNLQKELSQEKDEVYEAAYLREEIEDLKLHSSFKKAGYMPEHRKYGFTIFAETDDFWTQTLGKEAKDITVEDIKNWVISQNFYPNAKDNGKYNDPDNVLNQFVTYHILPVRIPVDKLVIHYNEKGYTYGSTLSPTVATWELYTTMGQRRLMKIYEGGQGAPEGIFLNRFPNLDNDRSGTYHEKGCDMDKEGILVNTIDAKSVVNGYIYPIDKVLAYSGETRNNFQKQRLRFDVAGIFPEFMNNDLRANHRADDRSLCVGMPVNTTYKYLEDLDIADGTLFYYLSGYNLNWKNYQGDEINVVGKYEMTFRLPPVPRKDTYEIRYAVQTNSGLRGMCQVYFGEDKNNLHAEGIPLDLRMGGTLRRTDAGNFTSIVGWESDRTDDDDYNAEVDKKMRNNGFMKGPNHYRVAGSSTARSDENTIRRIIVRKEMEPEKTYYLKFKTVLDKETKEFYMDYIEFCAKAVYDNPSNPEDIW